MKRFSGAVIVFFVGFGAVFMPALIAQANPLFEAGSSVIFERGSDGRSVESRQPYSIRGGYRFAYFDLLAEYSQFRSADGAGMVAIVREHQEALLWARHLFLEEYPVAPYLSLGAGVFSETVQTEFATEVSRQRGAAEALYAVTGGVRFEITRTIAVAFEARAAYAQTYEPKPLLGVGLLAGICF